MQMVQEIELAVSRLSLEELARFREWFDEFEADAKSGKLDRLANQAIADFRASKCKEL